MQLKVIGLNHKSAPIEIREKFYLNELQQSLLLSELKSNPAVAEALVLSTCNRTEIYLRLLDNQKIDDIIMSLLCSIKNDASINKFRKHLYTLEQRQVLEHLFSVACGMDSQVLGEKQILGQVKKIFEVSKSKGMSSTFFNVLGNIVIKAGKKAQAETNIGFGGSSVSWAAIVKAEKELGTLKGMSVLMIGAGKMSKLTVGHINNRGFSKLYLMSRTHCIAEQMASDFNGEAIPFSEIKDILNEIDLCICASSAPHYILEYETVLRSIKKEKKRVFIDISMPRNIDPMVAEIKNTVVYDIDHLDSYVESNMREREKSIVDVKEIIRSKLLDFEHKIDKINSIKVRF